MTIKDVFSSSLAKCNELKTCKAAILFTTTKNDSPTALLFFFFDVSFSCSDSLNFKGVCVGGGGEGVRMKREVGVEQI